MLADTVAHVELLIPPNIKNYIRWLSVTERNICQEKKEYMEGQDWPYLLPR